MLLTGIVDLPQRNVSFSFLLQFSLELKEFKQIPGVDSLLHSLHRPQQTKGEISPSPDVGLMFIQTHRVV